MCFVLCRMVAILRSLPQKQLVRALKEGGEVLHAAFSAHIAKFDHIAQRYRDALDKTRPASAAAKPASPKVRPDAIYSS